MQRIISASALVVLALVQQAALLGQEPAFGGGRPGIRYEQSAGVYHFVYECQTGLEFSQPAEMKAKLEGYSERALCWSVTAFRLKGRGAAMQASPMVSGRLVVSATHFRFLPNDGKSAEYYADFPLNAVQLQHVSGQAIAFFGVTLDLFYKFAFANYCPACGNGTVAPATKNVLQLDQEFAQLQASLKDFDGVYKTISDLSMKNRIEIRSGNQPDRGDGLEPAHLYSEMNTRLAGFCPEPAKGCFQAFAKYEACKSASWDAECGPRPTCSASCFATLHDLQRLDASACVQADQQAANLVPDWSAVAASDGALSQPAKVGRAGYLEIQMAPGPNSPAGVGCGVSASRSRAKTLPPSFGVAGMEGLGGATGGLYGAQGPKDIKMVPGESGLKVVTGPDGLKKVNISAGIAQGMLLKKVVPVYPPIAIAGRVQGTVVLQATIAKTGEIENLHAIAGPPLLQGAALDAVNQWQYKPYLLNGEPVEVETTVNVIFSLGGEAPAAAVPVPVAPAKADP